MNFDPGLQANRRDFIKLMSSLGLVALSNSGCAFLLPVEEQAPAKIALRKPDQMGRLDESQLTQLWEIFDHIGEAWGSRELCTIQSREEFEPILTLKTSQRPSYLTEYRGALKIYQRLCENIEPQQALHRLYFDQQDEPLKLFVITEFLRLHIAHGSFRFLPYRNAMGFAGGSFRHDDDLPYRGLSDSC